MRLNVVVTILLFFALGAGVEATIGSITLSSPANNTWSADVTPDFSFTALSDSNTTFLCELFIDGIGYGSNASTANNTPTIITANASLAEGMMLWAVNCTDANGTIAGEQRALTIDITAPTSTVSAPANNTVTADTTPEISFTLTDTLDTTVNYRIFIDGSATLQTGAAANNTTTQLNLTVLSEGTHTFIVQGTDEVGNSANSTVRTIVIDATAPDATINTPANNTRTNDTSPEVNFTLTDNIDTAINYTLFINGTANSTGSVTNGTPALVNLSVLGDGVYTIIVQAEDDAGSAANASARTVIVDTAAPNVTSASPSGAQSTSASSLGVTLQVVTDELATCRYDSTNTTYDGMALNFSSSDNLTHAAAATHSSDGSITWYVRCIDRTGNSMQVSALIAYSVDIGVSRSSGGGGSLPPLSSGGTTFMLNKAFGRYAFQLDRQTHYVRVKEITEDAVTLLFTSDPLEVSLTAGEERNVDITGDGVEDAYVRLVSFTAQGAVITLGEPRDLAPSHAGEEDAPIPEPVAPEIVQETPANDPAIATQHVAENDAASSRQAPDEPAGVAARPVRWGWMILVAVIVLAVWGVRSLGRK